MRDRLITSSSFKHGLNTLGFKLSDEVRHDLLSSVWKTRRGVKRVSETHLSLQRLACARQPRHGGFPACLPWLERNPLLNRTKRGGA